MRLFTPLAFGGEYMLRNRIVPAVALSLAIATVVKAQTITVDGTLDVTPYGAHKAVQTNNTSFGDSNAGNVATANGSELDAAYAKVQDGKLYLMITGNLETNYNHFNIFIDDGRTGQNTINVAGSGANTHNMNGSKFSSGFNATYGLDLNADASSVYVTRFDMTQTLAPGTYLNTFTPGNATPTTLGGIEFSLNNSNILGVAGGAPSPAVEADALAVSTGLEMAIPLSQLGNPSDTNLKIFISLNGGGNNFLSNQFLPGLPTVQDHVGTAPNPYVGTDSGNFDFSLVTNHFFTVSVPADLSARAWALTTGGAWDANANWTPNTSYPNAITQTANLGTLLAANGSVQLNGARTVGRLVINNGTASYNVAPGTGGSLVIDDTGNPLGVDPLISVQNGSHEISAPVSLVNGVTVNTLGPATLTISGAISNTAGNITKNGGGVLVLSGNNAGFTGDIVSEAGIVRLMSNGAIGAATNTVKLGDPNVDNAAATLELGIVGMNITHPILTNRDLAANDNLRFVTSTVAGSNTISGTVTLDGGVVFGAASGGTLTVSGPIVNGTDTSGSAKHGVGVNGGGHVIISNAANTADGRIFVDSGTLVLQSGSSLAGTLMDVFSAGTAIINGSLPGAPKIYAQGKVYFPGNTTGSPVALNLATLTVDTGGLIKIADSTSTANPVVVTAGSVEFTGATVNGQIDLGNNQLITTNDQNTVRLQLQALNLITTNPGGTLGYKDTLLGTTLVQFAVAGDADLSGKVNTVDFNALAGGFGSGTVWTTGDFDYDGDVDSIDANTLIGNYGKTLPLASPALGAVVPEPASTALLAGGMLGLLGRRRRD